MELKPYEMKLLSMAPCLLPGDILLVDAERTKGSLRKGEIVVYREAGEGLSKAHRFFAFDDSAFGLSTKGDRNIQWDEHTDHTVFQGVALYRLRGRQKTKLKFRWIYMVLSYFNLFPGQRLPSWCNRTNFLRWFRS